MTTSNIPNPLAAPAPHASILKRGKRTVVTIALALVLVGGLGICFHPRREARPAPPDVTYDSQLQLCQMLTPADPCPIPAIDCLGSGACCDPGWNALGPVMGFQEYAQGEYVGRWRLPHVAQYRLRVDDVINFVFRVTRDRTSVPYELNVGDEISIESLSDDKLKRSLIVLPDGTITLPLLGQVSAANMTIDQLRETLNDMYARYYANPSITVTPTKVDTQLEDLRYTVGGRSGLGGQVLTARVTPEGTVQLPAVGTVPAQGLTLEEFGQELTERYNAKIAGIEVTPILSERAPRYVYVLGEVRLPGRYVLEAPTTVMQALAMAGSWNVGANIDQIVVFRRGDDWRLMATMLDLRAALLGKSPCPPSEIWVSDSDLIIVPKSKILRSNNFIELVFTKGLYGIFPFSGSVNFTNLTTLVP